jgi:integrase
MSTQKRRGVYYSRLRVPSDLVDHLGKREVVKSLHTSCYRDARCLAARWEAHVSELFTCLKRYGHHMTKSEINTLVSQYMHSYLEDCEDERASREITQEQYEGVTLAISDALETNDIDLTFNRLQRIARTADGVLEEQGIELDPDSIEYKRLCRELLKAEQQVLRIEARRWEGDYSQEPAVTPLAASPSEAADEPQVPLSQVITEFTHQKELDGSWRPRTGTMFKSGLALFLDAIGDTPINEISKADIRKYQEVLFKLPTSMSQRFPGKSVQEVLAMDTSSLPKLSKSSVDKQLRYVKGLFNWAKDNDYILTSPADALKLKNPGSQDEQREAFTDGDLSIIHAGDYAEQRSRRPDRYWIPLIMLYTGARLEEVAQLYVGDIKEVDGVWCIDINDEGDDKELKNPNSKRVVPIHSWLIEQGLLEHWREAAKQGNERLWPRLTKGNNGYGSAISKWFNERLRKLGIHEKRKVLYSTRHTVATRLKHADVQDHAIAELLGHKVEGITMSRYGKKLDVGKLKGVVEKLRFDGMECMAATTPR